MNFSVSLWDFLAFVAYTLIWGFLVNVWTAKFPDSTLSKALLFITS